MSQLDNFKEIRNIERRLPLSNFIAYNIFDIPILLSSYRSIATNEEREIFKNDLINYFGTMTDDQLERFVGSFEKQINEIFEKENIRYFKESKDLM
ncbi:hypothetical protein [Robertmurraya sp. FSL R5-0851]|uniref:hypothetical protein n=1 Tax=Robertmurraya sp. FSL R5-0851 TaxID=2921584 RepID=UPI0030F6B79E